MPEDSVEQQWPDALALILADYVHQDGATGKYFILGTYSSIGAASFPWTHPTLTAYAAVTNGHGPTPMKMRLIDVDDSREPIFESEGVLDFPNPLVVAEIVFVCHNVVFPEPGVYRLQLYGAGQLLRERLFMVTPVEPSEEAQQPDGEEFTS